MYGTEFDDKARALVMGIIGVVPCCPKCGAEFSARVQKSFISGCRVKCTSCEFYGTWRFGTILDKSRLTNTQFLGLFFKYTLPNDAPAIGKRLGLDPATVREWRERIITAAIAHP